jgi:hypothetical protein
VTNHYSINGVELTNPSEGGVDATGPESHIVSTTQANIVATIGGHIATEPPSGISAVYVWKFGSRSAKAVRTILDAIGTNRVCEIDTYGRGRDGAGEDEFLTDVTCVVQIPELGTNGDRSRYQPFDLTFTSLSAL